MGYNHIDMEQQKQLIYKYNYSSDMLSNKQEEKENS